MFVVYVIKSEATGRIYIGQTGNLEKRLAQHNDKNFDKRSFTKLQGNNWKLIYKEEVQTKKQAIQRERKLKSYQGRKFIKSIGALAQW